MEFTAPVAGSYFLLVDKGGFIAGSGGYRVRTVSTSPPIGGSRDQRDVFISTRFQGIWQPEVNASAQTTPAGYDEDGVTLGTNTDGDLYAGWYDWYAVPGKEISRYVVARSSDGGQTWSGWRPITSAPSTWLGITFPGSSNRIGPWQDVTSDGTNIFYVWTDGRNGDADVYSRTVTRLVQMASVMPTDISAHPGDVVHLQVRVQNLDDLFDWDLVIRGEPRFQDWPPQDQHVSLGASSTTTFDYAFTVPDTAAQRVMAFDVSARSGGRSYGFIGTNLTILATTAVGPEPARLALAAVSPNPASSMATVSFSLSRKGDARLAIYDIAGRRVRLLESGELAAGWHPRVWNGDDDSGGRVASGAYFVRLEAEGKQFIRRMVWIR
jgi:hypothetical protein